MSRNSVRRTRLITALGSLDGTSALGRALAEPFALSVTNNRLGELRVHLVGCRSMIDLEQVPWRLPARDFIALNRWCGDCAAVLDADPASSPIPAALWRLLDLTTGRATARPAAPIVERLRPLEEALADESSSASAEVRALTRELVEVLENTERHLLTLLAFEAAVLKHSLIDKEGAPLRYVPRLDEFMRDSLPTTAPAELVDAFIAGRELFDVEPHHHLVRPELLEKVLEQMALTDPVVVFAVRPSAPSAASRIDAVALLLDRFMEVVDGTIIHRVPEGLLPLFSTSQPASWFPDEGDSRSVIETFLVLRRSMGDDDALVAARNL